MNEQQQKNRKASREEPTRAAVSERLEIKPEDIDPHHDWSRLNAHGVMNVDFEERVDFRRLHRYRLGRARQAVRNSTLGGMARRAAGGVGNRARRVRRLGRLAVAEEPGFRYCGAKSGHAACGWDGSDRDCGAGRQRSIVASDTGRRGSLPA